MVEYSGNDLVYSSHEGVLLDAIAMMVVRCYLHHAVESDMEGSSFSAYIIQFDSTSQTN